ncbi:MAG: hypothetical protein M1378_01350 [Bacteroidetes bacterium]|nr:hypothetical protein [Bacteroidota bacterium]
MKKVIWLLVGVLIGTYFSLPIKAISKKVYEHAKVIATEIIREARGVRR